MTRFFKSALFPLILIVLAVYLITVLFVKDADGAGTVRKAKLARLDPYYEIVNDAGDHGNYIELYRVPTPNGGTVFCVVYSDQIQESGGGAGIDCDWSGAVSKR